MEITPPPCPPELQKLVEKMRAIICALAYVAEKVSEEEKYNERNAKCFLAADAWHDDYEKAQTEQESLIKELISEINTMTWNHPSPSPSELQTFKNKFQKLCNVLSLADASHKETLLKELNLICILKDIGWAELSRIRFKKQGINQYKKEDVIPDSRNMKNQIESLQKRLSAKEK